MSPSPSASPRGMPQLAVKVGPEVADAIAAEAIRLSSERGVRITQSDILRAAIQGHLARSNRVRPVQPVAPKAASSRVGGR